MTLMELLKAENIDTNDKEKVTMLQKFYNEGYNQGLRDNNVDYEYSLKYKNVVERLTNLFSKTHNPSGLKRLDELLNVMDEYDKENPSIF